MQLPWAVTGLCYVSSREALPPSLGVICSFVLREVETEREGKVGDLPKKDELGALILEVTHSNCASTLDSLKVFQGVV